MISSRNIGKNVYMDINQEIFMQLPSEIEMWDYISEISFSEIVESIIEKYEHII